MKTRKVNGILPDLDLYNYNTHFITLHQFEEGCVRQHFRVIETETDYNLVRSIAIEKARIGNNVDIMPTLNEHDFLRTVVFPDAKGFANADLRINGILYEVEQPQNPRNINSLKHRISDGANQANHVIIDLVAPISLGLIKRVCHSKFIDYNDLQLIEFRYQNEYFPYTRQDFETRKKSKKKPLEERGGRANP